MQGIDAILAVHYRRQGVQMSIQIFTGLLYRMRAKALGGHMRHPALRTLLQPSALLKETYPHLSPRHALHHLVPPPSKAPSTSWESTPRSTPTNATRSTVASTWLTKETFPCSKVKFNARPSSDNNPTFNQEGGPAHQIVEWLAKAMQKDEIFDRASLQTAEIDQVKSIQAGANILFPFCGPSPANYSTFCLFERPRDQVPLMQHVVHWNYS